MQLIPQMAADKEASGQGSLWPIDSPRLYCVVVLIILEQVSRKFGLHLE